MVAAGLLLVLAIARAGTTACPACGAVSGRVRSRYVRRLAGKHRELTVDSTQLRRDAGNTA